LYPAELKGTTPKPTPAFGPKGIANEKYVTLCDDNCAEAFASDMLRKLLFMPRLKLMYFNWLSEAGLLML
jgi:hypothetical protein